MCDEVSDGRARDSCEQGLFLAHCKPQSGPTVCDPMDYSLPDSSVYRILQTRMPCPPPGDLPHPGMEPPISYGSCIGRQVIYH